MCGGHYRFLRKLLGIIGVIKKYAIAFTLRQLKPYSKAETNTGIFRNLTLVLVQTFKSVTDNSMSACLKEAYKFVLVDIFFCKRLKQFNLEGGLKRLANIHMHTHTLLGKLF